MAGDGDEAVKVLISLPRELLDRIEDFRFAHRASSRAHAIRMLILKGLRDSEPSRAANE